MSAHRSDLIPEGVPAISVAAVQMREKRFMVALIDPQGIQAAGEYTGEYAYAMRDAIAEYAASQPKRMMWAWNLGTFGIRFMVIIGKWITGRNPHKSIWTYYGVDNAGTRQAEAYARECIAALDGVEVAA